MEHLGDAKGQGNGWVVITPFNETDGLPEGSHQSAQLLLVETLSNPKLFQTVLQWHEPPSLTRIVCILTSIIVKYSIAMTTIFINRKEGKEYIKFSAAWQRGVDFLAGFGIMEGSIAVEECPWKI